MDHWTDLPSEDHWKPASFTYTAIYTSCCLVFWARCTHQVFGSLNILLSHGFQDSPPDYSIILPWNIKKIHISNGRALLFLGCMGQTIFVWNPKREWKRKGENWEEKPVALNCFVAVKTKFKYCEENKGCLLVFIQKCTPQRFPAQYSNKKHSIELEVHLLLNIMHCMSNILFRSKV